MKKIKLLKDIDNYGKKGDIITLCNSYADCRVNKGEAILIKDLSPRKIHTKLKFGDKVMWGEKRAIFDNNCQDDEDMHTLDCGNIFLQDEENVHVKISELKRGWK